MRQVYESLDRANADPFCPIQTWQDAFLPSDEVVFDKHVGEWAPWLAHFRANALVPGHPGAGRSTSSCGAGRYCLAIC
jgi:hypothetical protein